MKFEHTVVSKFKETDIYKVYVKFMAGDADYFDSKVFTVKPANISQFVLELLILKNQFPNGRGGCRDMYDQNYYFNKSAEMVDTEDGYFEFMDDIPYFGDGEQNYGVREFSITYFDINGIEMSVTYSEEEEFLAEFKELNKKHQIGNYSIWDKGDELFSRAAQHYYDDVIALIDKHK